MKKVLDSNALKLIAIIAMTIDHLAWMLFPGYSLEILPLIMHITGRLTCPIMCYFVAEGFHYTKDVNKYTARLFIFALISHFAYLFAKDSFIGVRSFIPFYNGQLLDQTSVMWPLAWGLVMLRVAHSEKIKEKLKPFLIILICLIAFVGDWSCVASLCILAFGTNRDNPKKQMLWMLFYVSIYALVYFFALNKIYGILQLSVAFSIPLILMYNGKRGKNRKVNTVYKWLFYIYYPLHLFVIGLIMFFR